MRFFADASHVVFSWVNVPEYSSFGFGSTLTFQVRLYVDGSIQFSYSGVAPSSAVVGIAPGSAQPGTSVVSFHNDASAEYAAAVVERFGNTQEIDIVTVAQKFYETHEDAYDYLVIYNSMGIGAMPGALAYESTVRSSATGYGVPAVGLWPAIRIGGATAERDEHGGSGSVSDGSQRHGGGAGGGAGHPADGAGARVRTSVSGVRQHSGSGRTRAPSR